MARNVVDHIARWFVARVLYEAVFMRLWLWGYPGNWRW